MERLITPGSAQQSTPRFTASRSVSAPTTADPIDANTWDATFVKRDTIATSARAPLWVRPSEALHTLSMLAP